MRITEIKVELPDQADQGLISEEEAALLYGVAEDTLRKAVPHWPALWSYPPDRVAHLLVRPGYFNADSVSLDILRADPAYAVEIPGIELARKAGQVPVVVTLVLADRAAIFTCAVGIAPNESAQA